jgi:hypothetical protein
MSSLVSQIGCESTESRSQAHTLRKEAGSIIGIKAGIHAASRFPSARRYLVTTMHYADYKERVTVNIADLLGPANVAQFPDTPAIESATAIRSHKGTRSGSARSLKQNLAEI